MSNSDIESSFPHLQQTFSAVIWGTLCPYYDRWAFPIIQHFSANVPLKSVVFICVMAGMLHHKICTSMNCRSRSQAQFSMAVSIGSRCLKVMNYWVQIKHADFRLMSTWYLKSDIWKTEHSIKGRNEIKHLVLCFKNLCKLITDDLNHLFLKEWGCVWKFWFRICWCQE